MTLTSRKSTNRALALTASILAMALHAPAALAQSETTLTVVIEAQPLDQALLEVSRLYGVDVIVSNSLVRGITAPEVQGNLTSRQAIESLLVNTGLTVSEAPNGGWVILGGSQGAPIIVTGTKQNRGVQDTVESVAVITEEQIEQQALNNVTDILLRTANVSANGVDLNSLSIRGVALLGVGAAGEGSTSQVYVDGAPTGLDSNQGAFNLWDIAQVEVLRGPQSTTQGRNALSGALIVRSADPEYEWGAATRLLYGNENQLQASAMLTGPMIADQLAFRLAADYREVDFEVVNQDTGDNTRFNEALTLRGKLLFEPEFAEGLRLELIANYIATDFGQFGGVAAPLPSDPRFADFDPFGDETFGQVTRFEDNQVQRYIADISYDIADNWEIVALGTYEDTRRRTDFGPGSSNAADTEIYSAELRANFDYDWITGWFGGYYFNSQRIGSVVFSFEPSLQGIPTVPDGANVTIFNNIDEATENFAFFGDVSFQLTDNLRLNVGARYDNEQLDFRAEGGSESTPPDCIIAPFFPGLGGLSCNLLFPVSAEPPQLAEFEAFLPRASIFYDLDEYRSIGLMVSRGYRAGGSFVFSTPTNPGVVEVRQFDPEFLTNYEFAFRSYWPELNLTLNANLFYSDWTDQQVSIPGPTGAALDVDIVNAGSSEIYGLEIEASGEITPEFSAFANLGLVETQFNDFPFAETGEFANLAGNSFNAAPNVTLGAGFAYDQGEGLFFSSNVTLADSQFSDVENLVANETDAYALVNGRIGYRFGFAEISLFVNNLFDERFFLSRTVEDLDLDTGAVNQVTPQNFIVNDPRLFGIEARVRF